MNVVSKVKVQIQTRESITSKYKTNKYRSEGEFRNTLTCQLNHGSQNIFKTMTGDVIDISETLQQLSNESLLKKIKLTQVPVTGSNTRKAQMSNTSYQVRPFLCPMFRRFTE